MKKLLLVAMVAFGLTANAQSIKFGAKAGLNVSDLNGNDEFKVDSRTSFHVGAMAKIGLSDKFALQPELLYSAQGASRDVSGTDVTVRMDYITIPVMAKYFIAEGFNVQAGPQLGFNVNSEVEANGKTVDLKDEFFEESSFDFGLNFGLGYELPMGLTFDARYNLGLTDIVKDDHPGDAVKNSVFQISVGYFF